MGYLSLGQRALPEDGILLLGIPRWRYREPLTNFSKWRLAAIGKSRLHHRLKTFRIVGSMVENHGSHMRQIRTASKNALNQTVEVIRVCRDLEAALANLVPRDLLITACMMARSAPPRQSPSPASTAISSSPCSSGLDSETNSTCPHRGHDKIACPAFPGARLARINW